MASRVPPFPTVARWSAQALGSCTSFDGVCPAFGSGGACASDAFYPFPDGIDVAAEAGVAVVIQPGGGQNDQSVIEHADELGLAMVFTGERHFLH